MKLRVFTLRYDIAAQHFDDTMLRQFSETGVDALEVRDHMVTCDGQSVLVLLVTYRDTSDVRSRQNVKTQKAPCPWRKTRVLRQGHGALRANTRVAQRSRAS